MKTSVQFKAVFFLLTLLSLTGCDQSSADQPMEDRSRKVLVLINDQSASIQQDSVELQHQQLCVKRYLHAHGEPNMDLLLLNVNSNSGSAVNHFLLSWKNSQQQHSGEYRSDTDKMLDESAKASSDNLQVKKLQRQLLDELLAQQGSTRSNQTEILELIPELARLTSDYQSVYILFLSDMISESNLRDFRSRLPSSKNQAEKMALQDAQAIQKSFGLTSKPLAKVTSIDVLVPRSADQRPLVLLPFYYQQFCSEFGFSGQIGWASE